MAGGATERIFYLDFEFVTVADIDDEKRFDDSFMQFWKLKFGHKAKFCSDFEHKVWPRV